MIYHLLLHAKNDEELLSGALAMLRDLRVDPDVGFGLTYVMLTTRMAQLERKIQQRLGCY